MIPSRFPPPLYRVVCTCQVGSQLKFPLSNKLTMLKTKYLKINKLRSWMCRWLYLDFCWPPWHAANVNQMHPLFFAPWGVSHMSIFMLRLLQYIHIWWWITVILIIGEKAKYAKLEPHARIKVEQVMRSVVYICECITNKLLYILRWKRRRRRRKPCWNQNVICDFLK